LYHDLSQTMTQTAGIEPKAGQIATIYKSETDRRWLYICDWDSKSQTISYVEIAAKEQISIDGPTTRIVSVDPSHLLVRQIWDELFHRQHRVFLHCWT
jgi:hypothetical protein